MRNGKNVEKKTGGNLLFLIWLILAAVFGLYFIEVVGLIGYRNLFVWLWAVMSAGSFVLFIIGFAKWKGWISIPRPLNIAFWIVFGVGIAILLFLECLVLSGNKRNDSADYKYAIVLGCKVRGNYITKPLKSRLDTAVEFSKNHPKAMIIVSGGKGPGEDISEAKAMYDYLIECGVAAERIIMEDKSTDTEENIIYSMEKVDEYLALKNQGNEEELEDIRTAETAIITNNFHEFRATRIAKNKGIKNAESFAAET